WQEINAAKLRLGEDEELLQEKRKRMYSQKLFEGVHESYEALTGDGRALSSLALIMNNLHDLARIDQDLQSSARSVENIYYQLEDISFFLSQYKDNVEFEPEQLNDIENRLMLIDELKRKYGGSVEE